MDNNIDVMNKHFESRFLVLLLSAMLCYISAQQFLSLSLAESN